MPFAPRPWMLLWLAAARVQAQAPEDLERDLTNLLRVNTSLGRTFQTASLKPLTVRETPGIVSLITREDIQLSGARDLMDVLRTVPGMDFGVDNEGVVGLSMRGAWAHEGKTLLLVDGIEMVEGLYGNLQFGAHYPVEEIDTIEVVRGAGSAIYGGSAELCVISIRTRRGRALEGGAASLTASRMVDGKGRTNLSAAYGSHLGDLEATLGVFAGGAQRSDQTYTDAFGTSYSMNGQSDIRTVQGNVDLAFRGLHYRGLFERHRLWERDHYVEALPYAVPITFNTSAHQLQYDARVGESGHLSATLGVKEQRPWALPADPAVEALPVRLASRTGAGITYSHDLTPTFNVLVGGSFDRDHASADLSGADPSVEPRSFDRKAVFGQGILLSPWGNLTLGARYDRHSQAGECFTPRFAYTKAWTLCHLKLLAARAFRAPSLEALDLNKTIQPEKTTTLEAEVGGSLGSGVYASLNVFRNAIRDPIVYANDGNTDTYLNSGRMGTRGAEVSLQWTGTHGVLNASLAWADVTDSTVDLYAVPGRPREALGIPRAKLALHGVWRIAPGWTLAPTVIHSASRHAYTRDGQVDPVRLDPETLVNLFLRCELGPQGLSLGLGAYNLLNEHQWFAQPYAGGHAPLPGASREIALRVGWRM